MRILDLRFKNLNSLAGEWSIDLTNAAYASDGIFAITGPTGSGKTTILDAICLALYGRTPRLDKVTKGANEIMSRRTGECFAEVTFAAGDGRFRCCWSQNRARNRPDGELQAPKHELSDAVTGKILESGLRGVAERIEQATGMDFERFTRSMLLAQGGFAACIDRRGAVVEGRYQLSAGVVQEHGVPFAQAFAGHADHAARAVGEPRTDLAGHEFRMPGIVPTLSAKDAAGLSLSETPVFS